MTDTVSSTEARRLATLREYDILDTGPEEAFDRITRLAQSALRLPIVLVSLVDENRQWFKSRVGLEPQETPREVSFCSHAIQQDPPFIIPNALLDDRFADNPLVTGSPHIRFYAGVPLKMKDGSNLGTLCAIDTKPCVLTDTELSILSDLAQLVVDELELRQLATTDSLTGALTRRSFEAELDGELDRSKRYKHNASLILLDLDHLKGVNDSFGHAAGDAVLRNAANLSKAALRNVDVFGRVEGDQFAILLPETGRIGALNVVERLRHEIKTVPTSMGNSIITITASFGVTVAAETDRTGHGMLRRARDALREAKGGGTNRILFKDADDSLSEVA
ncbi:MAG: sensor domain-containing diguanylate cyclase [Alphaproteobacteria bacterium]|nr:sensor domain-containing diguanylate cyclase [Alphaproteobacteria bacterium]